MNTVLFVYGTLKREQRNNHFLHDQKFLSEAQTRPLYRLYDSGPHPALVEDPKNGVMIHGEVWQVNDEALQMLDEYESVPVLFTRRPIFLRREQSVSTPRSWDSPVQAYIFNGDVTSLKDCGDRWPPENMMENRR